MQAETDYSGCFGISQHKKSVDVFCAKQ